MATATTARAATLDAEAVQNFDAALRGPLMQRGDPGYDEVRAVYNAMIDKHPALIIDLSAMNGVRVDPEARTARVEGGATLGELHHATHAFGLATPSGIISTTGVGGITLGGGIGHLTRQLGLAIDNVLAVDMVLADGSFVTASADEHPELFWAVRGGGNFGVVTSFLFRLHPVATVYAGPMLWEFDRTA